MADWFIDKETRVRVEANQVTPESVESVSLWCHGRAVREFDALNHSDTYVGINVYTPEGMARAQQDDWIVKIPDLADTFYVVRPLRFKELFEPVES